MLTIACISLHACQSPTDADESQTNTRKALQASDLDKLSNTKWKLYKMNNEVVADTTVTLNFSGAANNSITFYGKSFVNNYGGRFHTKDNKLITEPGFATKMAAVDEHQNQLEQNYFNQINNAVYFMMNESELDVYSSDTAVLVFNRNR